MPQRKYIDFKLYITRTENEQLACQVALLPTAEVGETVTPVSVPIGDAPQTELFEALALKTISGRQLVELGKSLAKCLLPEGSVRQLFRQALSAAGNDGGVRLRLIIADNTLRQWPWEYTYLNLLDETNSMRGFLVLDPRVSFVRHEPLPYPHPQAVRTASGLTELKMLVAAALPKGQQSLNVDGEIDNIQKAIGDFKLEGVRLECEPVLRDPSSDELDTALRSANSIYFFHFAGHGDVGRRRDELNRGGVVEEGFLLLTKDRTSKEAQLLSADQLGPMLQRAGVRLAVLGACRSGERSERYPWDSIAGGLVARGIPAVIGMQYEVIDEFAVDFDDNFYTALVSGLSLDEAVSVARLAMLRAENLEDQGSFNVEWGIPVLYSRLPDGTLFPERMARAGAVAEEFRKVVSQTVTTIEQGGEVIGIKAKRVSGGVKVEQVLGAVKGKVIAVSADTIGSDASIVAKQEAGTVEGSLTGVEVDDI